MADLFRGKERVEEPGPDLRRDTWSGIANTNLNPRAILSRDNSDFSFTVRAVPNSIGDSMGGVDEHIQDHLIEFAREARNRRQIRIKICFHLGHIFPLIASHCDRTFNRFIEVDRHLAFHTGMGELFHGLDDAGHVTQTVQRFLDGDRNLL